MSNEKQPRKESKTPLGKVQGKDITFQKPPTAKPPVKKK